MRRAVDESGCSASEHTLDGKRWVAALGSWRVLSAAQLFESRLWQAVGPQRARAHGIEPGALAEHYRQRNLLRALPVDGGLLAAFPR